MAGIRGLDAYLTRGPEEPSVSPEGEQIWGILEESLVDQKTAVTVQIIAILRTLKASPETILAIDDLISGILVSDDTQNEISEIVEGLAYRASNCSACEKRRCEAEEAAYQEAEKASKEYEAQENARWQAMSEEEKDRELDRMTAEDWSGR